MLCLDDGAHIIIVEAGAPVKGFSTHAAALVNDDELCRPVTEFGDDLGSNEFRIGRHSITYIRGRLR